MLADLRNMQSSNVLRLVSGLVLSAGLGSICVVQCPNVAVMTNDGHVLGTPCRPGTTTVATQSVESLSCYI